jgi:parvulin-like peptidyl-prolyl isomerase
MKKVIVAAVLLGLLAATFVFAACGGNSVPAGAIATVGDATVTQEQFDQIWAQAKAQNASQQGAPPFPKEGTAQYDQYKASIVNYLVQNEIIKQQAAKMDISVTEKEYKDYLAQGIKSLGGEKKLDAWLKQQGLTRDQLKTLQMPALLQGKVQAKVAADAKVTEAQIKAYWDDPANKSQFVVPDSVEARHVLVNTKAEAEKVRQLLAADNSDANWKRVAKQYSDDTTNKDKGGSLGSFPQGRMVPEFDKVAFSIKPGTVSAPVKTQWGWHVLEVTKKTPGSTKTYEESKSMIEQYLKSQLQAKAWTDWLAKVTKDVGIVYAAGFDPKTLTASPSPSGSAAPASPAPSPTS